MGAASFCSCSNAEKGAATDLIPHVRSTSSAGSSSSRLGNGLISIDTIDSWDFNILDMNNLQVEGACKSILLNKRGDCSASEKQMHVKFVEAVCAGYLPNPYHNRRHALDVLHTVWRLGEQMPWNNIYLDTEQHAILIAAVAHDIGHFGLTNAFLIDVRDELAVYYNDRSPLENMHCNKLFCILSGVSTNVFSHLPKDQFRRIRKIIIDIIIHTDPMHHGAMVNDLRSMYEANMQIFDLQELGSRSDGITELLSLGAHKCIIGRTLMHAADLSNPSKPWDATYGWAKAVLEEFFAQGDKEKSLGMPVGMLNDRTKVNLPNSQLGFVQFMVAPFMAAYTRIFRSWWDFSESLVRNLDAWAAMYLEESGVDESSRVQVVRDMLQPVLPLETSKELEPSEAMAIEDTTWSLPADVTDFDVDLAAAMMPFTTPKTEDTEQNCVVVREVRRWRDEGVKCSVERGQYRELLLLYILSDQGSLSSGEEVILKFNTNLSHFKCQEEAATDENGKRILTVSVAADEMRSKLDPTDFDHLLTALLDKEVRGST